MTPEEIKSAIKDAVTAYATENTERAEQVLHNVLQAKMQKLVNPTASEETEVSAVAADEIDVDPDNPDAGATD